ncbi:MAG TPA: hypothetical protein VFA28_10565 [Bryobacteraceae bacterium]|nr:hypothetical protein [Bryobacteraceae bacterium]
MRVIEARLANGRITPIPLPHELEPFQLDPAVRQQFSKLLSQAPSVKAVDSVIAKAATANASSAIAMPASGCSLWDRMHPAAPAATKPSAPVTWEHPVFIAPSSFDASARFKVAPERPAGVFFWRSRQASYIAQKNAPGLWIRPLPVSDKTLANVKHIVSLGQITAEPFALAHAPYAEPIGAAFDISGAFVAVAEIYQQAARPKEMTPFQKTLFYLQRLVYIATGATHIAPVPGDSIRLVGVILKALDKACDELNAMRFRESAS